MGMSGMGKWFSSFSSLVYSSSSTFVYTSYSIRDLCSGLALGPDASSGTYSDGTPCYSFIVFSYVKLTDDEMVILSLGSVDLDNSVRERGPIFSV